MAHKFDTGIERFRDQNGQFISRSRGLKSSIARAQYLAYEKSKIKKSKITPIREVRTEGHQSLGLSSPSGPSEPWLKSRLEKLDIPLKQKDGYTFISFGQQIKEISKKFPTVNSYRLLYKKSFRDKKSSSAHAIILLHDKNFGYSIISIELNEYRRTPRTAQEWHNFMYTEAHELITETILKTINNNHGSNWFFIDLMGWFM